MSIKVQLMKLESQTGADELMLVSSIFDPEQRLKSYKLGSIAMQNLAQINTPRRAAC